LGRCAGEVEPADIARGLERFPCEDDRLADVVGPDNDGDAKAEPVTAAADLGDWVGGEDGRDHLGGEVLVELGRDPLPGAAARMRYLESDRERVIGHLGRLTHRRAGLPGAAVAAGYATMISEIGGGRAQLR